MSKTLNIALLGAGRIGQVHARTIAQRVPTAKIVTVADVNPAAAQACAANFAIPHVTTDAVEAIQRADVDAVLICSLTATHAPLIEAAAAAGKHIFCEKPLALTLEASDNAVAAAERAGVKLQLGFNRRFDANYARLRQAVTSGEIGRLFTLHIISRDPAPPPLDYMKGSGGLFADMTIHDFDMARFLAGSEVEEVYVQTAVNLDSRIRDEAGDIDTAVIVLRFANGVIGTIDNCRKSSYGYDQRAEVFGSEGAASTGNQFPNNATISRGDGVRTDLPLHFFMDRYIGAYQAEIESFVSAVVNDAPVAVTGRDGRAAFALAVAAKQSMLEKRPVSL